MQWGVRGDGEGRVPLDTEFDEQDEEFGADKCYIFAM